MTSFWKAKRNVNLIAGWRSRRAGCARGTVNPETLDDAFRQHELVLDLAPHLLSISTA